MHWQVVDWQGMALAACLGAALGWALTARRRLQLAPRSSRWQTIENYLACSEPLIPRKTWLALTLGSALAGALLGLLSAGPAGLTLVSLGYIVPQLVLRRLRRRRFDKLDGQVLDATISLVRSLRAGCPLLQAVAHLADSEPEPIRSYLAQIREMTYTGSTLGQAAEHVKSEVPSERLKAVLKVLRVAETQGMSTDDMVEALERLSQNMALHDRIRRSIQAQTAGTRATQWLVVGLVPFILLITLRVPTIVSFYRDDPLGRACLGMALALELIAIFAGREITRFRGPLGA